MKPAYPKGTADILFGPPPSVLDALRDIYRRIRAPESFCVESYAMTADGRAVGYDHPSAAQWSVQGAMWKAIPQVGKPADARRLEVLKALDAAADELGHDRIERAQRRGHDVALQCVMLAGAHAAGREAA